VASVSVKNVSVQIPIYGVGSASIRKALLGRAVGGGLGKAGSHVVVTALKDVSFEARDGDRIGLVGSNGSGKSTLLRVLSDVYPPTSGTVSVTGSVSPMFDAMLGMNLDASGMDNIRLCGRMWGLSPEQIQQNTQDVVDFTELGDFLNVPVRTYSTGMRMRLAFAIATVRQPDIFLIDEIIGAGDPAFFNKAFERIKGVISRSRILFVASHSDIILKQLCNKIFWLDRGTLVQQGDIDTVLAAYQGKDAQTGPTDIHSQLVTALPTG